MFTTGTEDHQQHLLAQYELCKGHPKILAQVEGAQHMEPESPGRLNPFDAHFLGCHVAGLESSCNMVYGSGSDSLCQKNKMTTCEIEKGPGPTPPAPTPSPQPPACQECFLTNCLDMHKTASAACKTCVQKQQW